ncbi:MAG: DUF4330 domain-containing protein [Tissierellia bacterium]|mgnify:FL=1|nr:DUF4330 domain-containing protein [Tissierellia bacterium]
MLDKNGKLFGKISIIDILIVLAIVFAGLFVVNKMGLFQPQTIVGNGGDKLRITFYQEEVNSFTANKVGVGDSATETLQNNNFGSVVDVEVGPSVSWGVDKDGKQVKSTKEGWSSIYISMETNGKLGPNGITIGGSKYYIGQYIRLRVGDSIFYGRISGAEKL